MLENCMKYTQSVEQTGRYFDYNKALLHKDLKDRTLLT